jgi:hypothetical protein
MPCSLSLLPAYPTYPLTASPPAVRQTAAIVNLVEASGVNSCILRGLRPSIDVPPQWR